MANPEDKLARFQDITGIDDPDLCSDILSAHDWDLDHAVATFTSTTTTTSASASASASAPAPPPPPPGVAWKLATLPFYAVSGALGLGAWIAGGILSRTLGSLSNPSASDRLIPHVFSEAEEFIVEFQREYGGAGIDFVAEGFADALRRSKSEFKLLFVYLHSPDHPDTLGFCVGCLCVDAVAEFVNENFVAWGGNVRGSEGFRISNLLGASRFPFCAVATSFGDNGITVLQQVEGAKSPEEMLSILQNVVEENSSGLIGARIEAEERMANLRLREEQDAAYRAALEADRARENRMKEEQQRLEREAAETERKRKEEEEARERAVREAAEKEATLDRRRQEKAMSLGAEPEKGPDVTQVLLRFPTGERRERRFHCSSTIKCLYDYVDSLDFLKVERYCLVSNFPRVSYGSDKHSLSLKEAGLHPQASLFVELET